MLLRGIADSPPDQSETLRQLHEIETTLRVCHDGSDWELAITADHDRILRELWELLLDVVCSPLWLRIRAAELLNVCYTLRSECLRVDARHAFWLRSIVSSSCQILDDLDPRRADDSTQLFHWLTFLEHLLAATQDARLLQQVVFGHATYASLLAKMVRLLGTSATEVFAATTICLAAFYRHERHGIQTQQHVDDTTSVLVDTVLGDPVGNDGVQHVGGALLHVINACGYPCPSQRLGQLEDTLVLLRGILSHRSAYTVVFVNDFKVLIDILLRETTDLPLDDRTRVPYLATLDVALSCSLYVDTQLYRKRELLTMLEHLLDAGSAEDSLVPGDVTQLVHQLLLDRIERLD